MALSINNPTESRKKLEKHFEAMKSSMQEMFIEDDARADKFNLQWNDF
jgi:glucose-6-phosphate isomerase